MQKQHVPTGKIAIGGKGQSVFCKIATVILKNGRYRHVWDAEEDSVFNRLSMVCAGLIVMLLSGCANDTTPLSSATQAAIADEQKADAPVSNTRSAAAPEDVVVEEIPAPKAWPACWLSARLSSVEAGVKERDLNFTPEAGRQEFRGKSANPIAGGDCVFNWFGQDNADEPWVAMTEQQFSNSPNPYDSIVTCIADSTPDCTCMTVIPTDPDGDNPSDLRDDIPFMVGKCIRATDTGRLAMYNVRNPQQLGLQPANGRCDVANASISRVLNEQRGEIMKLAPGEDTNMATSENATCRVDVEPFNPRDDEKDWFGDEIRDWAIVTCEDENTFCRSYALFYKSGEDQDVRGTTTEQGLMLICTNGSCEQVWGQQ